MVQKFRDLFKTFCKDTSILGLKYFYLYPDRISRCFWVINLTILLATACVLTCLLWNRFLEMPTRITIDNQFASVLELPYPSITICTPNQMMASNAEHLKRTIVDGNVDFDIEANLPQLMGFYDSISSVNMDSLLHLQELLDLNRHNARDVMASLPQSCDKFLVYCVFQAQVVNCKDIFKPILTDSGLCCIFNSPYHFQNNRIVENHNFVPAKPAAFGLSAGLTVVTDYQPHDSLNGTLVYAGAIKIMFNDWTEFPSVDESALVYPNVESFHKVEGMYTYCSEEVTGLKIENRNCVFPEEYQLKYFRKYHNSDCDLECYVREVWKRCYCVLFYAPLAKQSNACNVTKIPCIMETRDNVTDPERDLDECECPRECVSRKYKAVMNIGNLLSHQHIFYDHIYSGVNITPSCTMSHFFFANPFYTQQKQETVMSLINLVSNLGGVFGMCLGCSVISVLEILCFIVKLVRNAKQRALSYTQSKFTNRSYKR